MSFGHYRIENKMSLAELMFAENLVEPELTKGPFRFLTAALKQLERDLTSPDQWDSSTRDRVSRTIKKFDEMSYTAQNELYQSAQEHNLVNVTKLCRRALTPCQSEQQKPISLYRVFQEGFLVLNRRFEQKVDAEHYKKEYGTELKFEFGVFTPAYITSENGTSEPLDSYAGKLLTIDLDRPVTDAHLETLKTLITKYSSDSKIKLTIRESVSQETVDKLAEFAPSLYELTLDHSPITAIPKSWQESVNVLNCNSSAVTTLDLPKAEAVNVYGCSDLKNLKALNALSLEVSYSKSLDTVQAPLARRIEIEYCDKLTSLQLPQATHVRCRASGVESIDLPLARFVSVTSCPIVELSVPSALDVDCSMCNKLQTLFAPLAKKVKAYNCEVLPTLDLPAAEEVESESCFALTLLNAPVAKEVKSPYCHKLVSVELPEALEVNFEICIILESLKAQKAQKVKVNRCPKLTVLETPEAISINCSSCKTLPKLKANKAEEVYCDYSGLVSLELNAAKKVEAFCCGDLETIYAPLAKNIHIFDSKKISSLTVARDAILSHPEMWSITKETPESHTLVRFTS